MSDLQLIWYAATTWPLLLGVWVAAPAFIFGVLTGLVLTNERDAGMSTPLFIVSAIFASVDATIWSVLAEPVLSDAERASLDLHAILLLAAQSMNATITGMGIALAMPVIGILTGLLIVAAISAFDKVAAKVRHP